MPVFALLVFSISYSFWRGGEPERLGAAILLAMTLLQAVSSALLPPRIDAVDPVAVIIDGFGVIAFGVIALYARRIWPVWATSLQILSLSSHFAKQLEPGTRGGIYMIMKGAPTLVVAVILLVGTVLHRRRMRTQVTDRAWSRW